MVARRLALLVLSLALMVLGGCASSSDDASLVSLSVTTSDPTVLDVGETLTFYVRGVTSDGTSTDVSDRASCGLSSDNPPGVLDGRIFEAKTPGTTNIVCTYQGATGTLGIEVRGSRVITIAEIQRGEIEPNTTVRVKAVVFAVDPLEEENRVDFFAQDVGGGPYSGIFFYDLRDAEAAQDQDAGDALPEPLSLSVGDLVDVVGKAVESGGRSVIEFAQVQVEGTESPVEDTVAVSEVAADVWDGCLVKVEDVRVSAEDVGGYAWEVEDASGARLLVDTLLYDPQPSLGDEYSSITGAVNVWQPSDGGDLQLALAPRFENDLASGGSTDPVLVTIADIQGGAVAEGSAVRIEGMTVTAVHEPMSDGSLDMYVQDPAGGPDSGLFLRDFRDDKSESVAAGDVINVAGGYLEHNGRSVVDYAVLEKVGSATPVVDTLSLESLDLADYESALVRVVNVRCTNPALDDYTWEATDNGPGGTGTVRVDNLFYDEAPSADRVYGAIRGVVFQGLEYASIAPRASSDVGAVTIAEMQSGVVAHGSVVHLDAAVVYGLRDDASYFDFWAQDEGGGAYSGIHLMDDTGGAPADLAIGDLASVDGFFDLNGKGHPVVYYVFSEKAGEGTPVADVVGLEALSDGASVVPWLGAFVRVENVEVVSPDAGGLGFTVRDAAGATTAELVVGNELTGPQTVTAGHVFGAIRGAMYGYDGNLELWPRDASDFEN